MGVLCVLCCVLCYALHWFWVQLWGAGKEVWARGADGGGAVGCISSSISGRAYTYLGSASDCTYGSHQLLYIQARAWHVLLFAADGVAARRRLPCTL